jgi:hypothetical protein
VTRHLPRAPEGQRDLDQLDGVDLRLGARPRAPRQARRQRRAREVRGTLEKVCVDTVESGFMTKDLALLVGPEQKWLSTTGFLDKISANLKTSMG